jgi:IgA Peptidase M64
MEEDIFIFPSHEIHLARNTTGFSAVLIQVCHKTIILNPPPNSVDYNIVDVTNQASIQVINQNGVSEYIAVTKTLRVLTSVTIRGQDILRVTFRNSNNIIFTKEIPVHVHDRLDAWWLGNNSLSVPQDSRVFHSQVSLYAHFDAPSNTSVGVIADISGHGFIDLSIAEPTICQLDSGKRGKVKGLQIGNTTLTATNGTNTENIPIQVINFYGNPSNILDTSTISNPNRVLERVIHSVPDYKKRGDSFAYGTDVNERFNILFLAEGYTTPEKPLFDTAIDYFIQNMFSATIHQPYNVLSGNFNVWKAFIPSVESGITDKHKGIIPIITPDSNSIFQTRDSFYGIYEPKRDSDILYSRTDGYMSGDPRRYPPELNWAKSIGRHIASLSDTSNNVKGSLWYNDLPTTPSSNDVLKDYGLVIILYNADRMYTTLTKGNAHYGPFVLMPLSRNFFLNPISNNNSLKQYKLDVQYPQPQINPNLTNDYGNIEFTNFTFTHEFSHSFDIGDEYEGANVPSGVSGHSNIVNFDEIKEGNSPNNILSNDVKWKIYDRIEKSERILSINSLTQVSPTIIRLNITLATNNVIRWRREQRNRTDIYLREFRVKSYQSYHSRGGLVFATKHFYRMPMFRDVIPPTTPPSVIPEDPLVVIKNIKITNLINNNRMEIEIETSQLPSNINSAPDKLDAIRKLITVNGFANGLLYKPKKYTPNPVDEKKLIRREVITYIDTNKKALDNPGNTQNREEPPVTLVNRRGRAMGNRFPFKVIGVYEGADHSHTGAFRPAGDCRMRNSYNGGSSTPELCYVCQYYIVSLINPSMLEIIENSYPDFT